LCQTSQSTPIIRSPPGNADYRLPIDSAASRPSGYPERRVGKRFYPHQNLRSDDEHPNPLRQTFYRYGTRTIRRWAAADRARLIVALIRTLGLRRVHLIGFDFGGPTAVMVCAQAPDLIATLTLAATNVLTDTGIPLPLQLVRPPVVGDVFARLLFGRTGLSMMWFAAVVRRDRLSLADYRAMLRFPQGITSTRRLFQASLRDLPGLYGPVHAALSGIEVPCTVVWGDRDPFFPTAVGERTAAHIPGARFVQLKGCGHFLPAEDPGGFARVVEELVSGSTLPNAHVPFGSQGGWTAPVVANVG
jgi:pimeloyl-ACP methyl ester carboxylesterase